MGVINEDYTTWIKRKMDMVRKAERKASHYITNRFKQNPKQFTKNKFINVFFSVMMDELNDELSNGGTQDFDYSKVHQELRDYVEKLWVHLNKELVSEPTHREEQIESELTEKCWSGYIQKGMKTMFGKRYPNCVKKTK